MLQEKLEQESRSARRRRLQFLAGIAGGLAMIALAYVGIVLLRPSDVARDPAAVPEAVMRTPESATSIPNDGAADEGAVAAASEAARAAFKADLAAFQAELEPQILHDDFTRWDAVARRRILDGKEKAVGLFAQADYSAAVEELAAVRAEAETGLASRDRAFEDAFAAAEAALGDDKYDAAALAIARALTIRPASTPAGALKERIDALPALLDKIEEAAVARVENDLAAERRHLEAALAIDPGRAGLAPRLAEVRRLLREARFARHIADGLNAVDARDPATARRERDAGRAIYADRPELEVLDERIAALEVTLLIERLTSGARAASRADDWPAAEKAYVEVRRLVPAARDINDELAHARAINGLDSRLARHLESPERLATEAVAADAAALVAAAALYRADSPSLAARADALAEVIAAYARKVPVRIVSDGETNITVRGVGIVGRVTERTIELRPGRYTFEGIREGFRAVLKRVNISPGQTDLVLEIVPDERI